ncbi:MAG: HAMP domain-containing protein [Desulfuromonadales bacterium]|nr:HAMP domain-containing protein [Desulfuromonadales bacterium]
MSDHPVHTASNHPEEHTPRFRPSLITKLTLAISLILIGFMGILDYINLRNFRNVMIEYATTNADQVAEIIKQSTYDAMLKNDKDSLYRMVGRIAQSNSIERIRLIDRDGNVAFSNIKEERGSVINKTAEANVMDLISAIRPDPSQSRDLSRVYRTSSGQELLGFTKAIYNQPGCSTATCHFHRTDDVVLGVLDISVSLESLRKKSSEYRLQFIVLTCLLLLLIGVLITFLVRRLVNRPVQRLMKHIALVASGDLNARVSATSRDELGELSAAFNRMTGSLQRASEEINQWTISLEHKVEERSQEIQRMEAQLQRSEKLASLGKLVAGIAHEINNPLTGVLLYSSMVSQDKHLDPLLKPDMDRVIAETRRCAAIVKQLLEFSREAVPHRAAVSINSLLDGVIALLHHQPDFRAFTIHRFYDEKLPDVFVDPNQLQQVFVNLLLNAFHALPEGGAIVISTYLSRDGNFVCIEIEDNGCGIEEEHLGRIFDPFFTTRTDGTGLGLSISYGIVENNGGKIEVKSRVGVGSTFTVMLPVVRETQVKQA